jgi:PhnB protein
VTFSYRAHFASGDGAPLGTPEDVVTETEPPPPSIAPEPASRALAKKGCDDDQAPARLTELAWGDRVGRVRDPLGNIWWIQERLEDPAPDEVTRRLQDPKFTDAMQYV